MLLNPPIKHFYYNKMLILGMHDDIIAILMAIIDVIGTYNKTMSIYYKQFPLVEWFQSWHLSDFSGLH